MVGIINYYDSIIRTDISILSNKKCDNTIWQLQNGFKLSQPTQTWRTGDKMRIKETYKLFIGYFQQCHHQLTFFSLSGHWGLYISPYIHPIENKNTWVVYICN